MLPIWPTWLKAWVFGNNPTSIDTNVSLAIGQIYLNIFTATRKQFKQYKIQEPKDNNTYKDGFLTISMTANINMKKSYFVKVKYVAEMILKKRSQLQNHTQLG